MIKYNLKCKCGRNFNSWFSDSLEFDSLCKKKLIKCIYCDSSLIEKSLMAPQLSNKSNQTRKKNKLEKNIKKQLVSFRKYIEKNFKYVGENFTQEARTIHYDNKKSKAIYGKATEKDTKELIEEGIEVSTIPWINKTEN
tara:strand:+ start:348 stop:764 length:417 start_codon:yes stop_codon:yes gene_type:complete